MTVAAARPTAPLPVVRPRLALAVADANWFTTENLFREVRRDEVATLLLKCSDYRVALMKGRPPWTWWSPRRPCGPGLWQQDLVLPSGWMKQYPRWGMRPIRRVVRQWRDQVAGESRLALVMTYPHYLYLRDLLQPDLSVYLNLDDYGLYWPRRAAELEALERRAARESDLTVCVSRLRADQLRAAVPDAAARIRHLPHGAPCWSIAEEPWVAPAPAPPEIASLPRPYLGYVGGLEDRVDWALLEQISLAFPHATIVLVGRRPAAPSEPTPSDQAQQRVLARPNVHVVGWMPQERIGDFNRAFDVCLIPYDTAHPFNIACCPTKIMDSMGTGRPIVSTALPECRLYTHLFHVAETSDAFLGSIREILDHQSDDGRAHARVAWARTNTCQEVAHRLIDWLDAR